MGGSFRSRWAFLELAGRNGRVSTLAIGSCADTCLLRSNVGLSKLVLSFPPYAIHEDIMRPEPLFMPLITLFYHLLAPLPNPGCNSLDSGRPSRRTIEAAIPSCVQSFLNARKRDGGITPIRIGARIGAMMELRNYLQTAYSLTPMTL